jgi:hypothetical protein
MVLEAAVAINLSCDATILSLRGQARTDHNDISVDQEALLHLLCRKDQSFHIFLCGLVPVKIPFAEESSDMLDEFVDVFISSDVIMPLEYSFLFINEPILRLRLAELLIPILREYGGRLKLFELLELLRYVLLKIHPLRGPVSI